jgi:hypothetical protein
MIPALKYPIVALLYRLGSDEARGYPIYDRLCPLYDRISLQTIHEYLVRMSILGRLLVVNERDLHGRRPRHYSLVDRMRRFLEHQLGLPALSAFLDRQRTSAGRLSQRALKGAI